MPQLWPSHTKVVISRQTEVEEWEGRGERDGSRLDKGPRRDRAFRFTQDKISSCLLDWQNFMPKSILIETIHSLSLNLSASSSELDSSWGEGGRSGAVGPVHQRLFQPQGIIGLYTLDASSHLCQL